MASSAIVQPSIGACERKSSPKADNAEHQQTRDTLRRAAESYDELAKHFHSWKGTHLRRT